MTAKLQIKMWQSHLQEIEQMAEKLQTNASSLIYFWILESLREYKIPEPLKNEEGDKNIS